jgi:serine/threonine-protein kinase
MDVEKALNFIDRLVYERTGNHLNDLEREVFSGSWHDQTYEKIYPLNPQYVEKDVGYKLWKKLSDVLGEKVTKKRIKGAVERALQQHLFESAEGLPDSGAGTMQRVFVSHRSQEPELSLAAQLCKAIAAAGHKAMMANVEAIPHPEANWFAQIDAELGQCDYLLLLLSPQAAVSEMTIEELRRTKELQSSRLDSKPIVLPIRVNCPASLPLNHDLRHYLDGLPQWEWTVPTDTASLIQDILHQLENPGSQFAQSQVSHNPTNLRHVASLQVPPLPVAEPELPGGQVRLASAFYIDRIPYEPQCYREITHPGALIRIKAPRQMGKTSLMARILYQAREQGYRTVPLSFQHADKDAFTNLDRLLRWFCSRISRKLHLPDRVDEFWTDTYGSKDNCTAYFEDCLLPETDSPLVLGLDEVDRVFQYPTIADDFFGLLRAWYEEAGYGDGDSDRWEKLRLVVVHSTEVYVPLNVNQSPFNVGLPIELSEFSREQVTDLAHRHGLNWHSNLIEQLMAIVGGHPYLVRVALYHIAQQQLTLAELHNIAPTEAGIYGDHLRRHLWNLQQHPELGTALAQVVTAEEPVELASVLAFKLHSLGLVQLQGNAVTPRFELYRQYFRERLLRGTAGKK